MNRGIRTVIIVLLGLLILSTQAMFTVQQTEKAIVLQLGKPVAGPLGPGLHFKIPFIQNVLTFDSRVLSLAIEANTGARGQSSEVYTEDKKLITVDSYTKWRIVDPLTFFRKVRNENGAVARLESIIQAQTREALGRYSLTEIINTERLSIMDQVTKAADRQADELGIDVVDVRIKRTDLPEENERAIFGRMRAERERQAKQYRSEGREEAAKIRATADKERTIILAEANRESEMLRGDGDAQATRTYAEAFTSSREFYALKRSLEAYEKSFTGKTKMVISPETRFFRYMD